jgi:tRNA(Ile)-lysidine synthase
LRAYLQERGAAWIEDPANENEIYARVRARRALAELEGLDGMRLAALAERLQPHCAGIDQQAAALIADAATFEQGEIALDRTRWSGADVVKRRALDVLITAAAGAERGASPAQLETLSAALDEAAFSGATLAGAWLQPRDGRVIIRRDPGALAGRAGGAAPVPALPLPPNEERVWDGRVALTMREPGWSVIVEGGAPMLARGDARVSFAAAPARWLLRARVEHLLAAPI